MIKAAIFSDTHRRTALMVEAVRRSRPDMIIHLGDHSADCAVLREEFPGTPLYSVRGNCDFASDAPDSDIVQIGPLKAFITHGHLYNVKWSLLQLAYAAHEAGCDLALFGHTHVPLEDNFSGVRLINPGSAGMGSAPTWTRLEVNDDGSFTVKTEKL